MSEFEVLGLREVDFNSPVAIIGFPTVGLVGSILASYVSKTKNMEFVAGIASAGLPPYTLIQNGKPYPPVRVYGLKTGEERDLIVVTSEVTPRPETCHGIAVQVLKVLDMLGVAEVIAIEGVGRCAAPGSADADIVACGTTDAALDRARTAGLGILTEGLVHGITGVMLYECADKCKDMLALLCPADPGMPDPRASAALIASLSKLVPSLEIDLEPLIREAEEMESRLRDESYGECNDVIRQLYG